MSYASTVIDLKLETPVPDKGINILNKLFEVYNFAGIEDKNDMATRTLKFIQDRLDTITSQLDSVERNMENYKSKNEVINLSEQANAYFNNIKEFDKINSTIELQLKLLNDVSNYINSKGNKNGTVPSLILINDETLRNLLSELYNSEFNLDKVKNTAGAKSDLVLTAEEKVERIKDDIRENLKNIRNNFNIQKQNNAINISQNEHLYKVIPKKERELLEISRQHEIKNNIYTYLLQKEKKLHCLLHLQVLI